MILDGMENFEIWQLKCNRNATPKTAMDFLSSSKADRYVSAVVLPVSKATPILIDQISRLKYLKMVYLEMPGRSIAIDSFEAKRLRKIRQELGECIHPTVHS